MSRQFATLRLVRSGSQSSPSGPIAVSPHQRRLLCVHCALCNKEAICALPPQLLQLSTWPSAPSPALRPPASPAIRPSASRRRRSVRLIRHAQESIQQEAEGEVQSGESQVSRRAHMRTGWEQSRPMRTAGLVTAACLSAAFGVAARLRCASSHSLILLFTAGRFTVRAGTCTACW